ncbi:tRNA nucleotidyltransferase (CCA-adding enzyme) [Bacillus tianshenii]|uniref:CCA-adding enzyme n=1 Tax=Sutcliffiella tianshenii TaxID=1463404 RepID=A0ABS2NXZ8_9BACI|nr:CCA tRNA nucleotidyltransferase [Bacillus tianshenii]MBM7619522.1 tRNA nucleotidyltransferase (CCA-adding enzyme) [Bacillus tianshenii]
MNIAFHSATDIIDILEKAGHEAYFVGGSVRDHLMGRSLGDIDIATSATPDQIQALFSKTVDVGAAHGTIIVVTEKDSFEVTTYRTDGTYTDNRRPDEVVFVKSLTEDLKRRDFTMNAIAMNKKGDILDPFHGKVDIERKVIRTVGEPSERFHEDALRMFRALRFCSQLGFAIDKETFLAIKKHAALMGNVSIERKTVEMEKLLLGKSMNLSVPSLIDTGLFKYLPLLKDKGEELGSLSSFPFHRLTSRIQLWTAFAYLLKIPDLEDFLNSWKLPKKVSKSVIMNITTMNHFMDEGWNRELIYYSGIEACLQSHEILLLLGMDKPTNRETIQKIDEALPIRGIKDIVANGNDLVQWRDQKRGKWISELLHDLEKNILNDLVQNEAGAIKEWVRSWQQK